MQELIIMYLRSITIMGQYLYKYMKDGVNKVCSYS